MPFVNMINVFFVGNSLGLTIKLNASEAFRLCMVNHQFIKIIILNTIMH